MAFQKLTPSPFFHIRHPDPREVGPSTFTFCVDIYHESAHAIGYSTGTTPVIVMLIMASYCITLSPESFNMKIWIPSLESSRPMLDTSDNIITVYDGDF
jgi:hypothetical protein